MKLRRNAFLLLVFALLVAAGAIFAWHWLSADPGYVQVRLRDTTIETSAVVAAAALVLLWLVLAVAWRIVRWPFRAWGRSVKRRGRERLANGMTAFAEGDYLLAERELAKAAAFDAFRTPAQLVIARAAHERGADARAAEALDAAGPAGARAAEALRARFLVDRGRGAEAFAQLKAKAATGDLSLRGWRLLAEAAIANGEPQVAIDALPVLARSQSLTPETLADLETRALAAAIAAAPDSASLNAMWSAATRAQRRRPELIAAFARRAAHHGELLAAMDEIQSAQRREWSDDLALVYGELGDGEVPARTRTAEGWLAQHPNSAALLVTLARLRAAQAEWAQAEDLLERAIALDSTSQAWETLGDVRRGEGDMAGAADSYENALRLARGEATRAIGAYQPRAGVDTRPIAFEERTEHGVPRLPAA